MLKHAKFEILIWIGLDFDANFIWFLATIGLKFNWVNNL